MRLRPLFLALLASSALAASARGQDVAPPGAVLANADNQREQVIQHERTDAATDAVRAQVFSPEFIMENRDAIALSDRQQGEIVAELRSLQDRLAPVQAQMQSARARLIEALRAAPPNEAQVLGVLDDVLAIERDVKRSQIQTLVRLKAALTTEQRARLLQLRDGR